MSRPPANQYGGNQIQSGHPRNMSSGSHPSSHSHLATPTQPLRPTSPNANPAPGAMSRAERFEDEKRRIIESCFSKTDANGQLAESYITHIRITEDAAYPSSPPPPDSAGSNKKPRLIIIAVRSTGRVRMHKARENNNGSFSIGKTWNLEELTAIEAYANCPNPPRSNREADWRQWAGAVGFTVTITKPYYWQAGTSKEKDFFIASTVKIYRKYTKGQVPELKGFDDPTRSQILGLPAGAAAPPPVPLHAQDRRGELAGSAISPGRRAERRDEAPNDMAPPQPPFAQREQSRDGSRYRGSPGPPPSVHDPQRQGSDTSGSRQESPAPGPRLGPPGGGPRSAVSQEQMRARSREEHRSGPEYRPVTSPTPAHDRSARTASELQGLPPPGTSFEKPRSQSPSVASTGSGRDAMPRALQPSGGQRSASQQRNQRPSVETYNSERNGESALNGNGAQSGAHLFNATRQRWMAHPQHQQESAPQRPPTATSTPASASLSSEHLNSTDTHSQAASQEPSPAGIDLDDAATVGAVSGYFGPGHATADPMEEGPPTPKHQIKPFAQEPTSPPTPERSKRRPPLDGRNQSEMSADMRPAPLKQSSVREDGSRHGTPRDFEQADKNASNIRPLSVDKRRPGSPESQEDKMAMPGAFSPNPSPLGGTPAAATPSEEKEQPSAIAPSQPRNEAADQSSTQEQDADRETSDDFRPGLGPMIKKNQVRNKFLKAANAASAFKPRPGGAAEKILRAKAEREAGVDTNEVDGVSGFVPRPGATLQKESSTNHEAASDDLAVKNADEPALNPLDQANAAGDDPQSEGVAPQVEVSAPMSPSLDGHTPHQPVELKDEQPGEHLQTPDQVQKEHDEAERDAEEALFEQREVRKPHAKAKRRSNQQERNLAALGIERSLMEGVGLEFDAILAEFGWGDGSLAPKQLGSMEADLRREAARLEAGSWLSSSDMQREEKVQQVESLLDKAIQECDELEGLLTLYAVELGSLNDDVAFIEAQSQGLQVQSANQKLLHRELEGLVETMSLDRRVLEPVRYGDLGEFASLEHVESCIGRLYQAILTMDPSIRTSNGTSGRPASSRSADALGEVSSMKALREKKEVYVREATGFCQRLMQHCDYTFTTSLSEGKRNILKPGSGGAKRLNKDAIEDARKAMWPYSPLILFAKELSPPAWSTVLRLYYQQAQPMYSDAFKENLVGWKRSARKPSPDDAAILFTSAEKDEASAGSGSLAAARKLTVKRSQTLAKTLRGTGGGKTSADGRHGFPGSGAHAMNAEVFAGAMDEMAPLISQEQNFIVELFHVSSLENVDFLDSITNLPPHARHGANLLAPRPMDPNREMAKKVANVMDEVFAFYAQEIRELLEWSVVTDPIQGVGVMACLSKHAFYLQETNQEFLLQMLDQLSSKLQSLWTKFVDDQIRAVEDTKVKIKKRKGVINFIKIFPHFSAAVENVFAAVAREDYEGPAQSMMEVRRLVDDAYVRINKAMFDSLKVIAKESPSAGTQAQQVTRGAVGDDSEDKEMLNYHVLLIENMNHYLEEVDDGGRPGVLADWKDLANSERAEALNGYVGRVIRRPLGKLLDFLDSIESLLATHPNNPTTIASRPSYSRKAARNLLSQYDSKEVRRGIDTLRKRIEKHFGDADEEAISHKLIALVSKNCQVAYERAIDRMERIIGQVYPAAEGEKSVEIDFSKTDVQAGFRR
ncbi:hypothetical protein KC332_g183 [Hortaea werneckii]|uniref:Exocyst complex component Sec3 PIP2-binding N-terminal domain-containing protein n=2 Tax=Hortaea werneckii TaxID=91943 RepID=A0A3M7J7Z2_HORWE|nr:hypothetical protein KC358_g875 [Hortaea werneckii]OTA33283.1 hypothetical protein BTJ68_06138 [Hortaea werneckii EXF-2000]KAI6852680.1 hypothetical protein KC350_g677 [Hortaea werneckii]KAI6944358.1 hypothetical protein KC341_g888 [Hortaea werneckii]KAI6951377.1 hypothetical protein KC348_g116 [Hortaea werneckii]